MPKKDLSNQRFGKLTVIEDSGNRASNGGILWKCLCDCGNYTYVVGSNLTRKKHPTQTCGKCSKTENLIGQKFNLLTVIEQAENKNGRSYWKCLCDCGNTTTVSISNLKNGSVKSCGCLLSGGKRTFEKPLELEGKTFGELTVLKYLGESKWECQCSCGNVINILTTNLLHKENPNCGCRNSSITIGSITKNWEILEKTKDKRNGYYLYKCKCQKCGNIELKTSNEINHCEGRFCNNCRTINLVGKKFGQLLVLEQDQNKKQHWLCKCDCGNIVSVKSDNLKSGNTKSCGCLLLENSSYGEKLISSILEKEGINFERQKTFDSCRFVKTGRLAKFDFYLPDYNIIIEYDGEQHFKENSIFRDELQDIQERDNFKNSWCYLNNIRLIRIPYTDLAKINEEYIQELLTQ